MKPAVCLHQLLLVPTSTALLMTKGISTAPTQGAVLFIGVQGSSQQDPSPHFPVAPATAHNGNHFPGNACLCSKSPLASPFSPGAEPLPTVPAACVSWCLDLLNWSGPAHGDQKLYMCPFRCSTSIPRGHSQPMTAGGSRAAHPWCKARPNLQGTERNL